MLRWEWDLGGWGRAGLVPESDSVGFSFSRSTAGVKMYDPVMAGDAVMAARGMPEATRLQLPWRHADSLVPLSGLSGAGIYPNIAASGHGSFSTDGVCKDFFATSGPIWTVFRARHALQAALQAQLGLHLALQTGLQAPLGLHFGLPSAFLMQQKQ